jgi:GH43 family beta-xylosidase
MKRSALWLIAAVILLTAWPALCRAQATSAETFHNPLLPVGPDPWVISDNGFYYYMNSMGSNLTVWKTRDITDLAHAEKKVVWTPPASGPYSKDLWAPELHRLDGKWYIYFAADAGRNESHRIYVVENDSADPLQGEWVFKGKIADATDKWAIDATVFEDKGQRYILWSGWEGDSDGEQRIYIAHLKDPLTIDSARVTVTYPKYPWEHVGDLLNRAEMPHVDVNEGPEILQHGEDVFLIYSASGCWTDYYALGLVRAKSGTNLLDPASWSKAQYPVFSEYPLGAVYGPGHNGFFKSPDGKEDWIIYHANPARNQGCGDKRSPRIQPFTWNPDGTPDFGRPIPASVAIQKPSK